MCARLRADYLISLFMDISYIYTKEKLHTRREIENKLLNVYAGKEKIAPYIYPVLCAVRKAVRNNISLHEDRLNLFEQVCGLILDKLYYEGLWWYSVREKAIQECQGNYSDEEFDEILHLAYEIVRRLPVSAEVKNEQKEKARQEIDKLYDNVLEFRSSVKFRAMLEAIRDFRTLGIYNAMLVTQQKEGSSFVATASDWINLYGRRPKKGARPLIILKNFGPIGLVYELEDTEGFPFPESLLHPCKASGDAQILLKRVKENLPKEGIGYHESDFGASLKGRLDVILNPRDEFRFEPQRKNGKVKTVPHEYDMIIKSSLNDAEKCATIIHELGHYFAGHFYKSAENKNVPERGEIINNPLIREFEAETICWLVCERCGMINPSEEYLSEYLDENDLIPEGLSVDVICKAAGKVEKMLKAGYPVRQG